jgi:hypothetical protein
MQEKSKIYNIHTKAPTPPQTKPYGWQTPIPPPPRKSRRIKGFSENVGQLSLGVYIPHLNVPILYMISQKVVSPLSMSHLFFEDWILGTEMALVLSHKRGTLSNLTPKSLIVCNIQRICEQQLHTWPHWWTVQLKTISEKTSK